MSSAIKNENISTLNETISADFKKNPSNSNLLLEELEEKQKVYMKFE